MDNVASCLIIWDEFQNLFVIIIIFDDREPSKIRPFRGPTQTTIKQV